LTISAPPLPGAVDDLVDPRLRGPAHLHQIGQGMRPRGFFTSGTWYRVAAAHDGGDVPRPSVEFVG